MVTKEEEEAIRADEREKIILVVAVETLNKGLADLRAKVEALPQRGLAMPYGYPGEGYELVYRSDVLALFDGSNNVIGA